LKFLASSIRHEEEIKWIQIVKEEEKLSLFADDVILFLIDPKNCTKKNQVEIINSFGKVAGYKINIQQLFHIPRMHRLRKKSEKKTSFSIVSQTIQYLVINLTKEIKDLFSKNNKPLKKEIEEDIKRWKDRLGFWIGKINIVEKVILPKAIYMFSAITIKFLMIFCREIGNSNHEIHMETQKTSNNKSKSERKVQCWRHHNT
jgi:hypothetical protein